MSRNQAADHQQSGDQNVNTLSELGIVSAAILHEVKNSLQGVANALFLLDNDPNLSCKARERVGIARRELSRAFDISKQTLALVREEQPEAVAITEVLEEVLQAYSEKIAYKKITIDRRYKFNGTIQSNSGALRQVFANIVLNALESVPCDTGRLLIHTSPCFKSQACSIMGVQVLFADNGPGIPEKYKARVFEPMFSTKTGKGSGLGLWVTAKLVRKQNGRLRMHSSTETGNSGCCLSIFLPLSSSGSGKAATGRKTPFLPSNQERRC
jgi:signal transduction histidine kinase